MSGEQFDVWVDKLFDKIEMNESTIEDTFWLHLESNIEHKICAELDTMIKGINLVIQWKAKVLHLKA